MNKEIDSFYINKEEPNKGCLLALRMLILAQDVNISETTKYGMPCFCYLKKPMCYLWVDKKTNEPYILMVHGIQIDHPDLQQGERSKMKILRVKPSEDLPIVTIKYILAVGISLCL